MEQNSQKSSAFICDDNLGKLARYLRLGGFDTHFVNSISDSELLRIALDENRIILTRDNNLVEKQLVRDYLLIQSDHWPGQLRQVIDNFGLIFTMGNFLTRCLEDNSPIRDIPKKQVKDRVPPYVFLHQNDFRQCPACQRIYWPGTHVAAILNRLKELGFI